jgi:uncharacterized membrane protein YdjX (TVP38/TMEM64 family)
MEIGEELSSTAVEWPCVELLGMSAIPVETAAGVVFGFRNGFVLASAIGKLVDAASVYALGRVVLKTWLWKRARKIMH